MNLSSRYLYSGLSGTRKPFQLLLITILILGVYYPAFSAGWCRVDDIAIMNRVRDIGVNDLNLIFVPGFAKAIYYRPLIKFSFWLDHSIWNFYPFWMHAENVALHIFNAFLVYWLACQLLDIAGRTKRYVPLLAAVLFGLHPVNAESVNWIAGRSDVLAGFFVLLSANALLKARETGSRSWILMAGAAILPGFLTKEVALVFLPGAFALLIASDFVQKTPTNSEDGNGKGASRQIRFLMVAGIIALSAFLLLRTFGIHRTELRFGSVINRIAGDPASALVVFLQALGFYLKKLFIPVPLNFAILEVDPLYFFLGLPAVALLFVILRRNPMHGAFLVTGFFLISPAFMIAMGKFAWTSYAERYVYVASAFIIPAVVDLAAQAASKIPQKSINITVRGTVVVYLLFFAAVGFQRSLVWMNDETLFKDTIEKNPEIVSLRLDYARLLADGSHIHAACRQLEIVREKRQRTMERLLAQIYDSESVDLSADVLFTEAYILDHEGKIYDALTKYEKLIEPETKWSRFALERSVMLSLAMISRPDSDSRRTKIKKELRKIAPIMSVQAVDPELFYLTGKIFLLRKDLRTAKYYFKLGTQGPDKDDVYRNLSEKMLRRLNRET